MYHWLNGRPPVGLVTDHINGDVLDNRRSNLRFVSVSGNNQNRRGAEKDNRSGLRGVGSHASGRWRARHVLNGTTVDLGIYDSPEQASAIATQWRRDHFLTGAE